MNGHRLSWMGIHVPYEIKASKSGGDWHSAVDQAMTYIGHIFMEQLDRRFAFALVLCRDELTILMCDRSGLMVTKTPINIHMEPEMFIRVMAAFSCMSAAELGWDTDMNIYVPTSSDLDPHPVPSYQVNPHDIKDKTRYMLYWVIDVVVNGQVERYLTVRIISAMRSVEICSRATIVYEVIKYNERTAPTETFALKRYWLPLVAGDQAELYPWEGDIYETLDNGRPTEEKHVFASHNIKIGGELDTTFTLIRKGLDGTRLMKNDVAMKPLRKERAPNAETSQHVLSVADDGKGRKKSSPPKLVNRCHVNILMRSGYSLTQACSIPEYLKAFKDIITGMPTSCCSSIAMSALEIF
ncbi:hypothetical protein C0991_008193 [Blastosporella zonata]|nr:hypothetical protein C0991_008193 [Blastosporella zonata]